MKQILGIQRMMLGPVTHEVKSVRFEDGYSIRVFTDGILNQESRVDSREEIGPCAKDMLRWEDKVGNISEFAGAARNRNKG